MRKSSILSMTGFGRSSIDSSIGKVVIEIQSVNRKQLDVAVFLPKIWSFLESEFRKEVAKKVQRGSVSVRVFLSSSQKAAVLFEDPKKAKSLKQNWEKLATLWGYSKECVDFSFLVEQMNTESSFEPNKKDERAIFTCLISALNALEQMQKEEGKALAKELLHRLRKIEEWLDQIEEKGSDATEEMRRRLKEKIEAVCTPGVSLDERLLREVALFAEKVDISEEITRFRSHVAQYYQLLKGKEETCGRKMDFIIQEMGREVNTIGSKAMESKIAHLVIEIKSELEKMREQAQNIL